MDNNGELEPALRRAQTRALKVANIDAGGYSYAEIAARSGISLSTINRLFGGTRTLTLEQFVRIAAALEIDLSDLMDEIERGIARTAPQWREMVAAQHVAGRPQNVTRLTLEDELDTDDTPVPYGIAAKTGTKRKDTPAADE